MTTEQLSDKAVAKYLAGHAEPEAEVAAQLPERYGHALIVPAYAEHQSLFRLIASVPGGPAGPVLVVVVVNARKESAASAHEANRAAREHLEKELPTPRILSDAPPIRLFAFGGGALLLVDRAAPDYFLPEGQGVGLARKIGNDIALRLSALGRLASPWLHNTDADTLLTPDYFAQTAPLDADRTAAALYFYEHRFEAEPDLALAGRLYEISLRYYVLGLAWAGSPYAYQSMGSCLAIPGSAYAKVRGFPKKNAAEDFYVLDKLAKVGAIERLAGAPLSLEGRPSDRVPFGTGRALRDLTGKRRSLDNFRLYHPLVFAHLAAWLRILDRIASGASLERTLGELPANSPFFRADAMREALERFGVSQAIAQARGKSSDPPTLRRHLHTWFDAFRTLKLAHALRDGGLPSLPWREALAEAPFAGLSSSTEDEPEELRRVLAEEERRLSAAPAGVPAMADVPVA
jgi:Glycosyl transferase family group 2